MAVDVVMVMMVTVICRIGFFLQPARDVGRFSFWIVKPGTEKGIWIDVTLENRLDWRGGVDGSQPAG